MQLGDNHLNCFWLHSTKAIWSETNFRNCHSLEHQRLCFFQFLWIFIIHLPAWWSGRSRGVWVPHNRFNIRANKRPSNFMNTTYIKTSIKQFTDNFCILHPTQVPAHGTPPNTLAPGCITSLSVWQHQGGRRGKPCAFHFSSKALRPFNT